MKQVLFYVKRLQEVSHEIDLDRTLQNAIELADLQQQEREIIENTLGKHRNLDQFQGGGRKIKKTPPYHPSTIQTLNRILKKAGVHHLLESNQIDNDSAYMNEDEDSHTESRTHGWCKVVEWLEEAEAGARWIDIFSRKEFFEYLNETVESLINSKRRAKYYRRKSILQATRHAGLTMRTDMLSKLFNPQPRDPPEPQHMILDPNSGELRPCHSREENGKATKEHHQKWMGESKAEIQCLFGENTLDEVGISGVTINSSPEWIKQHIHRTVYNYDDIGLEAQEAVMQAHTVLAPLFREQEQPTTALQYPFKYDCITGEFSDNYVREQFYKTIVSTPGKSRDEGFTLHVLARLPLKWREGMLLFIQNVLVTRCPPPYIKQMSRVPIPKGKEKPGQTRPIALVNDIYGFITSMQAYRMSQGIEATNKLFPELKA